MNLREVFPAEWHAIIMLKKIADLHQTLRTVTYNFQNAAKIILLYKSSYRNFSSLATVLVTADSRYLHLSILNHNYMFRKSYPFSNQFQVYLKLLNVTHLSILLKCIPALQLGIIFLIYCNHSDDLPIWSASNKK
jgi:hypothetical protein